MSQEADSDAGGDAESSDRGFTLASSVTASKPPPESPDGVRVRSLVIFSFWAIVIFLGLPIWWWTTSIYRARLPMREMIDWADGKVQCSPYSFPDNAEPRCLGMQTYFPPSDYH